MSERAAGHARAIESARRGEWEEAKSILAPLATDADDPWLINDYAIALHITGNTADAVEALDSLGDDKELPALVQLNRLYLARIQEVLSDFDPKWEHNDHDGYQDDGPDPIVSVIVRTYKRPDFLAEALASLKAQTFQDFETIVINDGGDPASEDMVKESGLPRARYYMKEHGGRVCAMNAGLEMARGKYVTGLDDDDVAYPHHLEGLVKYLESHGAAPVAYADYSVATYKDVDGKLELAGKKVVMNAPYRKGVLFETNPCSIQIMVSRSCYEQVGRFIPALELAEDWEMWLRLAGRFDFHHVGAVTAEVRERPGDSNLTLRRLREKYYYDNLVIMMHKGLTPLSSSRRPELETGYKKCLALLDEFLSRWPDALTLINLRGLWTMKKPYAWFADHGRWFMEIGERKMASDCYKAAIKLDPFQPKAWAGMVKAYLGG